MACADLLGRQTIVSDRKRGFVALSHKLGGRTVKLSSRFPFLAKILVCPIRDNTVSYVRAREHLDLLRDLCVSLKPPQYVSRWWCCAAPWAHPRSTVPVSSTDFNCMLTVNRVYMTADALGSVVMSRRDLFRWRSLIVSWACMATPRTTLLWHFHSPLKYTLV